MLIICRTPTYNITSYHNGLSYVFINKRMDKEVFFQGDDATQFRQELDSLNPNIDYDITLSELWNTYECVSRPCALY